MDRYVYSSVQEESSAAVLVQVQYIYSHKLLSSKTAPVERPRDTTAICLLLCKEHSTVSVLVAVRGATVDFRSPPVLCRMVIAAPGSFAFLGCKTPQVKLVPTGVILNPWLWSSLPPLATWHAHGPYTACELCIPEATGCWRPETQISTNCHYAAFIPGKNGFMAHHLVRSLVQLWFKCRTNCNRKIGHWAGAASVHWLAEYRDGFSLLWIAI